MTLPLWFRAAIAAVIIAAVAGILGAIAYGIDQNGYRRAEAKWQKQEAKRKEEEAAARAIQEAGLAGVGIAFAAEAQKERIVEKKIIERVTEYVPITDPLLSGGFRLLHDAAATGQPLDHTGRIDAAPVTSQDAARTIAGNYADCRYDKARILKLQEVVRILNGQQE